MFYEVVYHDSFSTKNEQNLARNIFEAYVKAITSLKLVLDKIHDGEIPIRWENGIAPDPWPSITVKDALADLFDRFVNEMALLARLISETVMKNDSKENNTYAASPYTFSDISSHIKENQKLIGLIESEIKPDIKINLEEYQIKVIKIDAKSVFVRLTNMYVIAVKTEIEPEAFHYKEIEELIVDYHALLLAFNNCIIRYNQLNPDKELQPLPTTDIGPYEW
jgi:hypothetical protein